MKFTNADLATLIEALREAEEFKRSIINSELPPRSVPRREWDRADRENEVLWKQAVARYRTLRRRLLRIETAQEAA